MRSSKQAATRITTQYRTRTGMAYDLSSEGSRVTVSVSRLGNEADSLWEIEVASGPREARETLMESAPTRAEALTRIAASWVEKRLPEFDWAAATEALTSVRAL